MVWNWSKGLPSGRHGRLLAVHRPTRRGGPNR